MSKLTLSTDANVVAKAKRYAARRGTSVSAMVTRYLEAVTRTEPVRKTKQSTMVLGPITRQATGLARLPSGSAADDVLEAALLTKYGLDRRAP